MRMPKALKDKWVNALRSGKYKPGFGKLYDPREKTFCCLGVLSREALDNGTVECEIDGTMRGYPSTAFDERFGIERISRTGGLNYPTLAAINDTSATTVSVLGQVDKNKRRKRYTDIPVNRRERQLYIADLIEKEVKGY